MICARSRRCRAEECADLEVVRMTYATNDTLEPGPFKIHVTEAPAQREAEQHFMKVARPDPGFRAEPPELVIAANDSVS